MTKTVSTSKKPRKQHSPKFYSGALKLAERIGVAAAARELETSTEIAPLKHQLVERDG